MKNIIIVIFLLLTCSCKPLKKSFSEKVSNKKIRNTYAYLLNKNFIAQDTKVIDSIYPLQIKWFLRDLYEANNSNLSLTKFHDSLIKSDNLAKHENFYYPLNKILDVSLSDADSQIKFSHIRNNFMTVEIINFEEEHKKQLYGYTSSDLYLFKFQKDSIINTYKVKINY